MSDGYPTDDCISEIRKYNFGKNSKEITFENLLKLLDLIEDNCRWPEFCIHYELGVDSLERHFVVKFHYSTGGWSGHEELIAEIEKTWLWYFCWEQSRRGGHYVFEIDPNQFKQKPHSIKKGDKP